MSDYLLTYFQLCSWVLYTQLFYTYANCQNILPVSNAGSRFPSTPGNKTGPFGKRDHDSAETI